MYIVAIIIIIIVFLLFDLKNDKVEGYDAKYTKISIDDCASFCKTTSGCFGFGYNAKNRVCYPADNPILGRPVDTIFADDFKEEILFCYNSYAPAFEDKNSFSICENLDAENCTDDP